MIKVAHVPSVEELTKQNKDVSPGLRKLLRVLLTLTGSVLLAFSLFVLLVVVDGLIVPRSLCSCSSKREETPHLRPEAPGLNRQRVEE